MDRALRLKKIHEAEEEHELWQDYYASALTGLAAHTTAMFSNVVSGPSMVPNETDAEANCRAAAQAISRMSSYIADAAVMLDKERKYSRQVLAVRDEETVR